MIMPIALGAYLVANILSLILFFVVLIKLFKNEGALKGILGFFCGIYTFIWGWMKHKQLAMTRLMTVWSLMILLPFVLIPVVGVSSLLEMQKYVEAYSGSGDIKLSIPSSSSDLKKKLTAKKASKKKIKKTSLKTPSVGGNNGDWGQTAMAMWKNGQIKNPGHNPGFNSKSIYI